VRADGVDVGLPLALECAHFGGELAMFIGEFDLRLGEGGEHGVEFELVVSYFLERIFDPFESFFWWSCSGVFSHVGKGAAPCARRSFQCSLGSAWRAELLRFAQRHFSPIGLGSVPESASQTSDNMHRV
jgi:hypothetical protein